MRGLIVASLALLALCAPAHAQVLTCPDLSLVALKQIPPPAGAPTANTVYLRFEVRNVGRTTFVSPNESKQWVEAFLPTSTTGVAIHVIPVAGSGPVSLPSGNRQSGVLTATLPAGAPRSGTMQARIIYVAPADGGAPAPQDCSLANNLRNAPYRIR